LRPHRGLIALALAGGLWTCAVLAPNGAERPAVSVATDPEPPPDPPEAYFGSATCRGCHPNIYQEWKGSSHHKTVREPGDREREMLASNIFCAAYEPDWVLGGTHHLRFLVDGENAEGEPRTYVLPCSLNKGTGQWELLNPGDWDTLEWETRCQACHVTALRAPSFEFVEQGVGCESCHGPGSRHAGFADKGAMLAFGSSEKSAGVRAETMVCASCHLQGGASKATGRPYPHNYSAGDPLFDDLVFDWSVLEGAETNPIDEHQKVLIKRVHVDGNTDLACTSCHGFHDMTHDKHQALARESYCFTCHLPDTFAVREYRQGCNVCQF